MMAYRNQITTVEKSGGCKTCWMDTLSAAGPGAQGDSGTRSSYTTIVKCNKGDYLIRQGASESGVYCIQKGIVKVSRRGYQGREFVLWVAETGDMVGLDSFTDDNPSTFSATALTDVTACFIAAADLRMLLTTRPAFSMQLMQNLCVKLDEIEQRITSTAKKKVRAHCAEVLLAIAGKKEAAHGADRQVDYSIGVLASLIGTTRNYLYKVILELTEKDIVAVNRRKLVIKDMDALSVIAGDDHGHTNGFHAETEHL